MIIVLLLFVALIVPIEVAGIKALRDATHSTPFAVCVTMLGGAAVLGLAAALRLFGTPEPRQLGLAPSWAWLGGILLREAHSDPLSQRWRLWRLGSGRGRG